MTWEAYYIGYGIVWAILFFSTLLFEIFGSSIWDSPPGYSSWGEGTTIMFFWGAFWPILFLVLSIAGTRMWFRHIIYGRYDKLEEIKSDIQELDEELERLGAR